MNMTPKRNLVLIKADAPKETTTSGIYIVEDWKTLPPTGVVLAIGPNVEDRDLVGKHVLFERYGAITVDKDIKLCLESHIQATIED